MTYMYGKEAYDAIERHVYNSRLMPNQSIPIVQHGGAALSAMIGYSNCVLIKSLWR